MLLEAFSFEIFLKALLRVFPVFLIVKTPENIILSFYSKLFLSLILSLSLYARLLTDGAEASLYQLDLMIGISVGVIVCLFFSSALKLSYFFSKGFEVNEDDSWKNVLDSFMFIVLILFLVHLRIERSLLNILSVSLSGDSLHRKFLSFDFWNKFMTDVCFLGLKVSSFGLIFVLSKKSFDEIYLRIGGEGIRLVFSFSFFILLLILSPFLIPSLARFFSSILSSFWKLWMGA
jgi:hypothetical protein